MVGRKNTAKRPSKVHADAAARLQRCRACNDFRMAVRTARGSALPSRISATGYPRHVSCCMHVMRLEQEARRQEPSTMPRTPGRARFMDESVPAMVWTARPDMSCEYLSREWLEFTGYS